jgi:hypothetical protein
MQEQAVVCSKWVLLIIKRKLLFVDSSLMIAINSTALFELFYNLIYINQILFKTLKSGYKNNYFAICFV